MQGTIRPLEANFQGFEERASEGDCDITDATKRAKELESKASAHFECEECYQQLTGRQSEIGGKPDLAKNQARLMRIRLTQTSRILELEGCSRTARLKPSKRDQATNVSATPNAQPIAFQQVVPELFRSFIKFL